MLIYNLFPLLGGPFVTWPKHFERIAAMGFNWVFVNPIQRTGRSQSLYSVAEYNEFDPRLLDPKSSLAPETQFRSTVEAAQGLGLQMMTDLVANHCSVDSPLIKTHPEWFLWDSQERVVRASCLEDGKKVFWDDLAQFNHRDTSDPEGLYRYFSSVVEALYDRGFRAFRCDAAYQISPKFWSRLIGETKAKHPDALFLAETLGCPLDTALQTAAAGFDYVFNNLKWWNFRASWMSKQYLLMREIAPSVSFPESHDTVRLAEELHGNIEACKDRYLVSALFSAAVMMPMGFEFGFRRRLNVARTRPEDWEQTGIDISSHIRRVNAIKANHAVFQEDSPMEMHSTAEGNILILWKGSVHTPEEALIFINRDLQSGHGFHSDNLSSFVQTDHPFTDLSPGNKLQRITSPFHHEFRPGEALVLVTKRPPAADTGP
jgi:starch synthase (maltosyl-transferring)